MDKEFFDKITKERNSRLYSHYVLKKCLTNKRYFNITHSAIAGIDYPEIWEEPHFTDVYMILWFFSGDGFLVIDSNEMEIKGNRIFFIAPSQLHWVRQYTRLNGVAITFSDSFFALMNPQIAEHIKFNMFDLLGTSIYCDMDVLTRKIIDNLFEQLAAEFFKDGSEYGHEYILASLFTAFILHVERLCHWSKEIKNDINSTSYKTYLNFMSLVDSSFKMQKEAKWYAEQLGVSLAILSQYVKRYRHCGNAGMTPLKIINGKLFDEAVKLLKYSTQNVSQIAYELGFKDDSYFIKFFKRMDDYHRTPAQFRKSWNVE